MKQFTFIIQNKFHLYISAKYFNNLDGICKILFFLIS